MCVKDARGWMDPAGRAHLVRELAGIQRAFTGAGRQRGERGGVLRRQAALRVLHARWPGLEARTQTNRSSVARVCRLSMQTRHMHAYRTVGQLPSEVDNCIEAQSMHMCKPLACMPTLPLVPAALPLHTMGG